MSTVPRLTDGVVTLRAHRPSDVQRSWEQCQDPESIRWTTVPVPYSQADAEEFNATMPGLWESDAEWIFAVEYAGRYAGTVSLRNERSRRAEIAYGSHPDVRGVRVDGRSVMERALRLLLAWGFEAKALETVIWWAERGNWASRRLAWRLGFRVEGMVRQWQPQRGELRDGWVGTLRRGDPQEPATAWLDTPRIAGAGVVLRPLAETDVPRIVEACSDERTQHWLGTMPAPYSLADAIGWIGRTRQWAAEGSKVHWAIADPETDLLLGAVNVFDLEHGFEGEIGYWTHPDARGRGVMTEAARLAAAYSFDELGVQILRGVAAVDNAASRHVLESLGMRLWGVERAGTIVRTGRSDAARYDVTVQEYAGVRPR